MQQHTIQTPYTVGEVHFYSTEINGNLVLFDTGPPGPQSCAYLKERIDLKRLKYLFITHCHVDHYGLSDVIAKETDAEIFFPRSDIIKLRHHNERSFQMARILTENEIEPQYVEETVNRYKMNEGFFLDMDRCKIAEEAEILDSLGISCLAMPSHSQSDLVYLHGNHAVTGDILLRNVFQTPLLDIDLGNFSGRFKNYDAYCETLMNLSKLKGYTILPGHRWYIEGLEETILSYLKKLLKRARQVKRFEGVKSVQDVIRQVFGDNFSDQFIVYLKASEIVFMRDFLENPQKLKESLEKIGLFDQVSKEYSEASG